MHELPIAGQSVPFETMHNVRKKIDRSVRSTEVVKPSRYRVAQSSDLHFDSSVNQTMAFK
jgi:hypothetical protein